MKLGKALADQLAYVYGMTPLGGATVVGCGQGDYNRFMRLLDAGAVEWAPLAGVPRLVITEAGRKLLQSAEVHT